MVASFWVTSLFLTVTLTDQSVTLLVCRIRNPLFTVKTPFKTHFYETHFFISNFNPANLTFLHMAHRFMKNTAASALVYPYSV